MELTGIKAVTLKPGCDFGPGATLRIHEGWLGSGIIFKARDLGYVVIIVRRQKPFSLQRFFRFCLLKYLRQVPRLVIY